MLPYRDSRVAIVVFTAFFILVVAYGIFEGRALLLGPQIAIPAMATTEVHDPLITIRGTATHIASLTMNGVPVEVTESGSFEAPYALSPGYNKITFDASDKYGGSASRTIEVVYTPPATSTLTVQSASSSPVRTITATSSTSAAASSSAGVAPAR